MRAVSISQPPGDGARRRAPHGRPTMRLGTTVPRRLSTLAHAHHLSFQAHRRRRPTSSTQHPAPRDRLHPARAITCRQDITLLGASLAGRDKSCWVAV
ncbi:hypothetical protein NDU88_001417 [Pleurodeles waltl]|uniref:Uncharacterized protein n=1 Tax=Pleurodeles waltl TaxID=8319 RepID=A0AAV7WLF9_PLEWA|nr:hypothetical protein NDU88_001417 [Pleurodeles waltl]